MVRLEPLNPQVGCTAVFLQRLNAALRGLSVSVEMLEAESSEAAVEAAYTVVEVVGMRVAEEEGQVMRRPQRPV
jgi:hypothetical protein